MCIDAYASFSMDAFIDELGVGRIVLGVQILCGNINFNESRWSAAFIEMIFCMPLN